MFLVQFKSWNCQLMFRILSFSIRICRTHTQSHSCECFNMSYFQWKWFFTFMLQINGSFHYIFLKCNAWPLISVFAFQFIPVPIEFRTHTNCKPQELMPDNRMNGETHTQRPNYARNFRTQFEIQSKWLSFNNCVFMSDRKNIAHSFHDKFLHLSSNEKNTFYEMNAVRAIWRFLIIKSKN